jgi:hypothetical protein
MSGLTGSLGGFAPLCLKFAVLDTKKAAHAGRLYWFSQAGAMEMPV